MSLVDLQRQIQSVCLEPTPPSDALSNLGNPAIFEAYRGMVRRRLYGELKFALKRSYQVAGEPIFSALFSHFMATRPPRSRYFYRIPVEFAAGIDGAQDLLGQAPVYLPDLIAFEASRWEVSDLPGYDGAAVQEFTFDRTAVVNPALRVLQLNHAVDTFEVGGTAPEPGARHLAVYRCDNRAPVRYFRINRTTCSLLRALQTNETSVASALQGLAQTQGLTVDQTFIDALCGVLADFLERKVILGTR